MKTRLVRLAIIVPYKLTSNCEVLGNWLIKGITKDLPPLEVLITMTNPTESFDNLIQISINLGFIKMRVAEKSIYAYPWYLRPFFWNQKRKYGQILKPALIWARIPKLFAAVAILFGVLDRRSSPITPILRSLITVRVSQINSCLFCIDINSAVLAERTNSLEKVIAIQQWHDSNLFDSKEKTVLEYVEAITYTDRQVGNALMQRLAEYFNEDEIVEITGLIAFQNMSSKFNSALDIPAQGFCNLPDIAKTPADPPR